MKPTRIIVFAKAPQPGAAKTRLIPALGAQGAADLARRMLIATLHSALGAKLGPVELCVTPEPGAPAWRSVALPGGIGVSAQGGGDLGARLARAAQRAIERGEPVMLIGTDCIEMSTALLREAAAKLHEIGTVIYCTADGGYALLGLTRFDARLFADMPWSTAAVAAETQRRIGLLNWPLHVGRTLHDVDEPKDLNPQRCLLLLNERKDSNHGASADSRRRIPRLRQWRQRPLGADVVIDALDEDIHERLRKAAPSGASHVRTHEDD